MAKSYLLEESKSDKPDKMYFKNSVIGAIEWPNNQNWFIEVHEKNKLIKIINKFNDDEYYIYTFDSMIRDGWKISTDMPIHNSFEIILRILFEMAKSEERYIELNKVYNINLDNMKTRIDNYVAYKGEIVKGSLVDIFLNDFNACQTPDEELLCIAGFVHQFTELLKNDEEENATKNQKEFINILKNNKPLDFNKVLSEKFNQKIREITKGNIIGLLLTSSRGRGQGGLFKLKIGDIKLHELPEKVGPGISNKQPSANTESKLNNLEKKIALMENKITEILNI